MDFEGGGGGEVGEKRKVNQRLDEKQTHESTGCVRCYLVFFVFVVVVWITGVNMSGLLIFLYIYILVVFWGGWATLRLCSMLRFVRNRKTNTKQTHTHTHTRTN